MTTMLRCSAAIVAVSTTTLLSYYLVLLNPVYHYLLG